MQKTPSALGPEFHLKNDDTLMMYCFKVLPCARRYRHDWKKCPYSHPTEKARRRDPLVYKYLPVFCPEERQGLTCLRGDSCPLAHNVFEFWLHPFRYKTVMCQDLLGCKRGICFFAHTPDELREADQVGTAGTLVETDRDMLATYNALQIRQGAENHSNIGPALSMAQQYSWTHEALQMEPAMTRMQPATPHESLGFSTRASKPHPDHSSPRAPWVQEPAGSSMLAQNGLVEATARALAMLRFSMDAPDTAQQVPSRSAPHAHGMRRSPPSAAPPPIPLPMQPSYTIKRLAAPTTASAGSVGSGPGPADMQRQLSVNHTLRPPLLQLAPSNRRWN